MRRLGWGLAALVLAFGLVGLRIADAESAPAAPPATLTTTQPPTRISLFGDSLAHQARPAFVAALTRRGLTDRIVSTRPGAALCDDRQAILGDLLRRRPEVLVLEYSGNSFTGCMRDGSGSLRAIASPSWRDRYVDDLRVVLRVAAATNTSVVWATAPPVRHPPDPDDYPRLLAAAAREVASSSRHLRVVDTGTSLMTDERSFARTLSCRSDERTFCVGGRIPIRAADGLHFDCHGTVNVATGCDGYSAGGRRFGEALADAALATR